MIDFIEHLTNPEKYHTVPPRIKGEKDEQYKARLGAYVQGKNPNKPRLTSCKRGMIEWYIY